MREIKFRAWAPAWKRMYYADESDNATSGFRMSVLLGGGIIGMMSAQDFALMQFTGLLDKNGREIYEGDILGNDLGDVTFEVYFGSNKFDSSLAAFCFRDDGKFSGPMDRSVKNMRIIGNIHENGDLLK